jgi:Diadenosine tetraphosphate (Ap4A) hydrolase and other HIT family hydrolases
MADTIFSKIIKRQIPADIVYEDEQCLAFRDINPQAPVHILIIPKKAVPTLADATDTDSGLLGHLLLVASKIAGKEGYGEAFRLVINNGESSGQTVYHLHVHLLAGRNFSWPPG